LFNIVFYANKRGDQPVKEYIDLLKKKADTDKNSRIKLKKIYTYLSILERNGTRAKIKYIKYLEDGIWEIRPLANRILFFFYIGKMILLFYYITLRKEAERLLEKRLNKQNETEMTSWKGARHNE